MRRCAILFRGAKAIVYGKNADILGSQLDCPRMMPKGTCHVLIEIGAQPPFQVVGGDLAEQPAFVFAKGHAGNAYGGVADPDHLPDGVFQ